MGEHTKGPLKVVLDGTLTGITAEIHSRDRVLGETELVYVRRKDAYPQNNPAAKDLGSFDEAPDQYELTEEGAEALANAHLWAAATDLLEALEKLFDGFVLWDLADDNADTDAAIEAARAAIAKARGQ